MQKHRIKSRCGNKLKPGGLGAAKLVTTARNSGIELTVDMARELIELWLETFPEMSMHLKPPEDPNNFGFYIASTIHGRYRSCATYNAACNYRLTVADVKRGELRESHGKCESTVILSRAS